MATKKIKKKKKRSYAKMKARLSRFRNIVQDKAITYIVDEFTGKLALEFVLEVHTKLTYKTGECVMTSIFDNAHPEVSFEVTDTLQEEEYMGEYWERAARLMGHLFAVRVTGQLYKAHNMENPRTKISLHAGDQPNLNDESPFYDPYLENIDRRARLKRKVAALKKKQQKEANK